MFKPNYIVGMVLLCLLAGRFAYAHKVIVFAYVEGDTVYCESKLAGGKKVRQGKIEVYDPKGNILLTGKTDDNGEFFFKIPKKTDLRIILNAGQGHRAEWIIQKQEMEELNQHPAQAGHTLVKKKAGNTANYSTSDDTTRSKQEPCVSAKDVQDIVDQSLDRKLKPIRKMLAESLIPGPSITDIIGGIGYIIGLVGTGAYFNYRRKSKNS